jgi:hypothetical protein
LGVGKEGGCVWEVKGGDWGFGGEKADVGESEGVEVFEYGLEREYETGLEV